MQPNRSVAVHCIVIIKSNTTAYYFFKFWLFTFIFWLSKLIYEVNLQKTITQILRNHILSLCFPINLSQLQHDNIKNTIEFFFYKTELSVFANKLFIYKRRNIN